MIDLNTKKHKIILVVTAVIMIAVSFFCGFFIHSCIVTRDERAFSEIADYLKKYGVFDSKTLELRELSTEELADILLGNLNDGYATYYTPEEYKVIKENSDGNYLGVGISMDEVEGGIKIKKVSLNSPAFYSGMKIGDIIYKCNDKTIATINDFGEFLSDYKVGQKFTVYFMRGEEALSTQISKEEYVNTYVYYMDSEKSAYFLSENYGEDPKLKELNGGLAGLSNDTAYIALTSFEGDAAEELDEALDFMKSRGKTKLIFDLRNNGGGYMSVLCDVASYFIGKGPSPIAYAKDNKGKLSSYYSNGNNTEKSIANIAVIANEKTASASECLIGAMLYYKHNFDIQNLVIENEQTDGSSKTFGKGIMQTTYDLSNGGALKLTTAIIYQPDKSTCIHGTGVVVSGRNAVKKSDGIAIERANDILSAN